jgi:hypothetical protein
MLGVFVIPDLLTPYARLLGITEFPFANSLAGTIVRRKYFSEELLSSIITWKEDRNDLVHALMKQSLHIEDLKGLAEQG